MSKVRHKVLWLVSGHSLGEEFHSLELQLNSGVMLWFITLSAILGQDHLICFTVWSLKVLSVFTRYILSSETADDWDEPMARFIVDLLLDHYADVLQVPSSLADQINSALDEKKSQKTQLSQVFLIYFSWLK